MSTFVAFIKDEDETINHIERADGGCVFVTFEESPEDIRKNVAGLGWDIQRWEQEGKWAFVDASPQPEEAAVITGSYDLGALLARIEHAIQKVGAKRVSMDSVGAIFSKFEDSAAIRGELFRIVAAILKFRGTTHQKGEYPFTVIPGEGIIAIPLSAIELKQRSSTARITTGNSELDKICNGGFFRDSITLHSGATGAGKTLMVAEFINGGIASGERCLLFAFEESREQLTRNASGWGIDFEQMEKDGKLKMVCEYPESAGQEDHLIIMKKIVEEFKPNRIALDSLSALERISTIKGFREFVIALTSFIKQHEVAGLFTATTTSLMGGTSVTEAHISTITDSIILLRYVEMYGEMQRGITVLKMRGSMHDKDIRRFFIDGEGMHIGEPFRNVTGILTGQPTYTAPSEIERIKDMFAEDRIEPEAGK